MNADTSALRVAFMGSPPFAAVCLRAIAKQCEVVLAVAQPDKRAGRGRHLAAPAVKITAQELGIPVAQPVSLKGDARSQFCDLLRGCRPDVLVVVAYGKILPQEILDIPRLGSYNVHASLLPRHRGAAPIQWAIIEGDSTTGVCIMQMDAGLDTGPVVSRASLDIGETETSGELFERLAEVGASLMVKTLPQIQDGSVTPVAQDHAHSTYARMLTKDDGVLDFRQSASAVSARARGVDPWPGAQARRNGETVKLWGAEVIDGAAPPGVVVDTRWGLDVACGADTVRFSEVQLPGRKRMSVAAAVAGRALEKGTRFDLVSKESPT